MRTWNWIPSLKVSLAWSAWAGWRSSCCPHSHCHCFRPFRFRRCCLSSHFRQLHWHDPPSAFACEAFPRASILLVDSRTKPISDGVKFCCNKTFQFSKTQNVIHKWKSVKNTEQWIQRTRTRRKRRSFKNEDACERGLLVVMKSRFARFFWTLTNNLFWNESLFHYHQQHKFVCCTAERRGTKNKCVACRENFKKLLCAEKWKKFDK